MLTCLLLNIGFAGHLQGQDCRSGRIKVSLPLSWFGLCCRYACSVTCLTVKLVLTFVALYAGYKILQRIYKFGGQPYFNDYLTNNYKSFFVDTFGERNGKSMMSATAGR